MAGSQKAIKGKRIILRRLRNSDAKQIYKYAKHKDIARFTDLPYPYKLEHAKGFIKSASKAKEAHSFGVQLIGEEGVAGIVTISKIDWRHKRGRIGFWLGKDYHGKGLMSEALFLMLDFAFKQLKLNKLSCSVFEENTASHSLVQKFGFLQEGKEREDMWKFGRFHNTHMYGLLKKDWLKKRKKLMR